MAGKLDRMLEQSQILKDQKEEYGFIVFPEVDRKPDGTIGSTYPCWYHQNQLDSDMEDLRSQERQLEQGMVPGDRRSEFRTELEMSRDRLAQIMDSMPRPEGPRLDKIAMLHKTMEEAIKPSIPSEDDMRWGDADAHQESRAMKMPTIKATNEQIRWLLACGINPATVTSDNYVSRDQMIKGWKIAGRILDLNTNTKALYKSGGKQGRRVVSSRR